jgi:hypothetical protein
MRRLLATVLLLLPLLAATSATPARAARNMEIGLQDDGLLLYQWSEREGALEHARELGVTTLRVNLLWSTTLPGQAAGCTMTSRPTTR